MRAISRREFGRTVLAAVPVAALGTARVARAASRPFGVATSSFADLPRLTGRGNVDEVIRALHTLGVREVELALANVEPAPPSTAPVMGGSAAYPRRIVLTPEEVAATDASARGTLRAWRLTRGEIDCDEARRSLDRAGIAVTGAALAYNPSFTDEEIDATLRQVRRLGASVVSSPLTLPMARRLAPFAERHQVTIAIHNQVDGGAAEAIDTPRLAAALALSPSFALKLDVGNVTASNADPVAVLARHRDRVACVLVKDRLRNGGASQPLGEGDTPLPAVVRALAAAPRPIPVLIGYDYAGLRGSVEEVRGMLAYLSDASQ